MCSLARLSVTNWKTITLPQQGKRSLGHRSLEERGSPSAEAAAEAALLPGLLRGDGARELAVLAPEEDLLVPLLVRGALYLVRLILQSWDDLKRDAPAY